MSHQILFTDNAKKDIAKLDVVTRKRLAKKLKYFVDSDKPLGFADRLISPKIGSYRFRVGDYRVIFDLSGKKIIVLRIRHRREVYQ
jgi:mRNA interferase RelE/StbE